MDLVIYIAVLACMLFIKSSGKVQSTSIDTGVMGTVQDYDIQIGSNLELRRNPNAFLLIVKDMGLLR